MRVRVPLLAIAVVSGAVSVAIALFPGPVFASHMPLLRQVVDTVPPFIALVACLAAFGRFRSCARLNALMLACSFGVLGLSELAFVTIPLLLHRFRVDLSVWAALAGSAFGAVLFMLAAWLSRRRLRRSGLALAVAGAATTGTLLLIAVLAAVFAARLPAVPVAATARGVLAGSDLRPDAVLSTLEVAVAATYGVAAAGFLRRSERFHDEFSGWLAVSAVLASAAHLNYFLYPTLYLSFFSVGDMFCLCFYAALLAGSARELWSYWRAAPEAAVREERRRIARDLHDGPAQELAYLLRNLDSLNGTVDTDTKTRLRRAAEHAQLELRLAIDTFAPPRRQSVNVAIAQAVSEIAARDHIRVELDLVPGIRLPATRTDALLRIACEAVGNAARHSGTDRVSLSLQRRGSSVRLCIIDDGSGFDPDSATDGFGLISMRDRVTSVGGDLRISSAPGCGTRVEATL